MSLGVIAGLGGEGVTSSPLPGMAGAVSALMAGSLILVVPTALINHGAACDFGQALCLPSYLSRHIMAMGQQ